MHLISAARSRDFEALFPGAVRIALKFQKYLMSDATLEQIFCEALRTFRNDSQRSVDRGVDSSRAEPRELAFLSKQIQEPEAAGSIAAPPLGGAAFDDLLKMLRGSITRAGGPPTSTHAVVGGGSENFVSTTPVQSREPEKVALTSGFDAVPKGVTTLGSSPLKYEKLRLLRRRLRGKVAPAKQRILSDPTQFLSRKPQPTKSGAAKPTTSKLDANSSAANQFSARSMAASPNESKSWTPATERTRDADTGFFGGSMRPLQTRVSISASRSNALNLYDPLASKDSLLRQNILGLGSRPADISREPHVNRSSNAAAPHSDGEHGHSPSLVKLRKLLKMVTANNNVSSRAADSQLSQRIWTQVRDTHDVDRANSITVEAVAARGGLQSVIDQCILRPIKEHHAQVNGALVDIFGHLQLSSHFDVLRDVFFLADSSLLVDFCNELFENAYSTFTEDNISPSRRVVIRPGKGVEFVPGSLLWDEHRLNTILTSSTTAARRNSDLAQKLAVSLTDPTPAPVSPADRRRHVLQGKSKQVLPFDHIRVEYRVPWPVDQVIQSTDLSAYNTVYQMLLNVKAVVFALRRCRENLARAGGHRCATSTRPFAAAAPSYLQRLQTHVAEYAHVIRSLEDFLLNQSVFSSWETFQQQMEGAASIFEIREAHQSYLQDVLQQTLLNPSRRAVQKVIRSLLVNTIGFVKSVHALTRLHPGVEDVRERSLVAPPVDSSSRVEQASLSSIEKCVAEFRNTILFMLKLLDKHSVGGAAPALRAVFVRLSFNNFYDIRASKNSGRTGGINQQHGFVDSPQFAR